VEAVRTHLKPVLPEHMVPAAFVMLERLPLTANGKLDRHALPTPQMRPEELGEYVAPSTEIERTLAELWTRVLRVDRIGIHDNFFELGGHSLSGMTIITQLASSLDIRPPIATIFQYPTIHKMTHLVEQLLLADSLDHSSTQDELEEGLI
jgi:acyl carrier protein